jgi:hypothetical protein
MDEVAAMQLSYLRKRARFRMLLEARHGAPPRSMSRRSIARELQGLIIQMRAGAILMMDDPWLATVPTWRKRFVRGVLWALWYQGWRNR